LIEGVFYQFNIAPRETSRGAIEGRT